MKIAIVGPSHPYKGGIAKHTTELANHLESAGHSVTLITWKHQYPFFYPGQQFVPNNKPEVKPINNTYRVLSWRSPYSWPKWGRALRSYDKVIFVWWVPTIQGPIYYVMFRSMGHSSKTLLLCHNVLPHERKPADALLTRTIIDNAGAVLVHSSEQAQIAQQLGAKLVHQSTLPPVFPPKDPSKKPAKHLNKNLLFFGLVRPYKGLDVLIRALATVPKITLTVAGEIWGENIYKPLAEELHVSDRITFLDTYIPDSELQELFLQADALVLPYRGGTATFNAAYAHYYGIPVIATTAASLAGSVRDGVDGLLCEKDDPQALAQAISAFYSKDKAMLLKNNVRPVTGATAWKQYISEVVNSS